jgi:hypothetical protein
VRSRIALGRAPNARITCPGESGAMVAVPAATQDQIPLAHRVYQCCRRVQMLQGP